MEAMFTLDTMTLGLTARSWMLLESLSFIDSLSCQSEHSLDQGYSEWTWVQPIELCALKKWSTTMSGRDRYEFQGSVNDMCILMRNSEQLNVYLTLLSQLSYT